MRPLVTALTTALVAAISTGVAALTVAPQPSTTPTWHLTATVAESCSCTIACPCNFGGNPNRNPCEGNRLIAIQKGNYGNVDLSGVAFLITFEMRSWSKIYISDKVSDAQKNAVEALLPVAFGGFHRGMLSFSKAPITMEITDTHVRFSTPESAVDMEVMRGFDGKSVRILNLPNPAYQNYTQFRSIVHTHTASDRTWSHTDTNGFTSTMDVGSR